MMLLLDRVQTYLTWLSILWYLKKTPNLSRLCNVISWIDYFTFIGTKRKTVGRYRMMNRSKRSFTFPMRLMNCTNLRSLESRLYVRLYEERRRQAFVEAIYTDEQHAKVSGMASFVASTQGFTAHWVHNNPSIDFSATLKSIAAILAQHWHWMYSNTVASPIVDRCPIKQRKPASNNL